MGGFEDGGVEGGDVELVFYDAAGAELDDGGGGKVGEVGCWFHCLKEVVVEGFWDERWKIFL